MPEIFNGDGCSANVRDPHRMPVRKATVIALRCTPCVPVDAPADAPAEFDKICNVQREDPCTLRATIAIRCPPREIVYAPSLDVGTTPGGSDVVSAGAPASCVGHTNLATLDALPNAPEGLTHSDATTPMVFYARLTHGSLSVAPPQATAVALESPAQYACYAHIVGDGPAVRGGRLRAIDAPQPLRVACACEYSGSGSGAQVADARINLALRVVEYSSPLITYTQSCAVSSPR